MNSFVTMAVLFPIPSDFILIYNSNFILCTDRARICFKCYVKEKRKCSFVNALVEMTKRSNKLK